MMLISSGVAGRREGAPAGYLTSPTLLNIAWRELDGLEVRSNSMRPGGDVAPLLDVFLYGSACGDDLGRHEPKLHLEFTVKSDLDPPKPSFYEKGTVTQVSRTGDESLVSWPEPRALEVSLQEKIGLGLRQEKETRGS